MKKTWLLFFTLYGFYSSAQNRLDFNSYLQENLSIIAKKSKPEKNQFAFDELKTRVPANQTNPDAKDFSYGLDKNGNVNAGSGSIWGTGGSASHAGSSSGGNSSAQTPAPTETPAPTVTAPVASPVPADSAAGGSSPLQ